MDKFKLNGYAIRRILLAVFCLFIGICVSVVMFNLYIPNKNAIGALCSVCMDVICMIILFIFLGSFAFGNYSSNRTSRIFAFLLAATIWAVFLDFLNWAFDGTLDFGNMTFWFTLGSLCMGAILACIFSMYLYNYMKEMHRLSKMRKGAIVCSILNIISLFITFILAISGTAFKFVAGHYEVGALYDIVTVIPILTLLYMTGYIIYNVKQIGWHDVCAVVGYISFMIAGALIETVYRIGTTYVAVSIADIFIFVMLQNEILAQEKRNVQKWMKKSKTDELTGFYNRQAYEDDLTILEGGDLPEDFVYISVDVNSLKMTNDSLGHSAGDELLIGAAECLKICFGSYGKLYRIGGDEFIALINIDANQLNTIKDDIVELSKSWQGKLVKDLSFSCGYVSRIEVGQISVREMAILADRRMYEAKAEYYRVNGIERRKK